LVGFRDARTELDALDVKVVASSVDPLDKAKEVADEVGFPIGFGVTHDIADALGSWWEDRRNIIQPSEFLVDAAGKVLASSYSDGPIGRFEAGDVIRTVRRLESMK
jgi:peroxiredoxin